MGYDFEAVEGGRSMSLNVIGMSLVLDLLDRRDVLDWDDSDRPAGPDDDVADEDWDREWYASQARWHAARQAAEHWRLPTFKLRSNDDWLVFPSECRLIADALRAATPEDAAAVTGAHDAAIRATPRVSIEWGDDRVRDLLALARRTADFAEAAAGLGGFRVT